MRALRDIALGLAFITGITICGMFIAGAIMGINPLSQRRWMAREIEFSAGAKEIIWTDKEFSAGDTVKLRIYTYVLIKKL